MMNVSTTETTTITTTSDDDCSVTLLGVGEIVGTVVGETVGEVVGFVIVGEKDETMGDLEGDSVGE